MKTSNFANNQRHNLQGISISRYPDRRSGFTGPEFPPLMPSAQLLADYKAGLAWEFYQAEYEKQLECLSAFSCYEMLKNLAGGREPILLCYESAKTLDTHPCHRRLVADWFNRELAILVPEWAPRIQ